jgi:hypothetical protein
MRIVTLIPVSKRGKQLVKTHGDRWEVVKVLNKVLFSTEAGPWMHVEPITEPRVANTVREAKGDTASRWIHAHFDKDFKVAP